MLRNRRFYSNIYIVLLHQNKHFKRFGLHDNRYRLSSCRFFSSDDKKACDTGRGKPVKTKDIPRPDRDSAPLPPGTCPGIGKTASIGQPALMDTLPKPEGPWYEMHSKNAFRRNFILLLGALFLAATAYTVYLLEFIPISPTQEKKEAVLEVKKVKRKSRRPWVIQKNPSRSSAIPNDVQYLLIGGGTASFSAFRAIKSIDPKAQVLVIGNEPYYPYMRPPLSKEMFYIDDQKLVKKLQFKQWNGTERSVFYEPDDFYSSCESLMKKDGNGGVAVARGWTVNRIDPTEKKAYLEDGKAIKYQKCLIATGAKPKNHPVFTDLDKDLEDKISLYRNIFDFEELASIIDDGAQTIAVIGGSFLGSELACALARKGRKQRLKVIQIFKEPGNMGKILPEYLSKWTTDKVQKEGVSVVANMNVDDIDLAGEQVVLSLNNGKEIRADHVVLALGVEPNTELSKTSDLETDKEMGGYLVNAELEARSNLFVAGDCACFYDAKLGRRRVEHHDHAVVSGRLAGENMTGAGKPYFHQSMFWSDLGPDVGFEAIGIVDSALPTVGVYAKMTKKDRPKAVSTTAGDGLRSDTEEASEGVKLSEGETLPAQDVRPGEEDYGKGVIFYLRDGTVVGIVLWNVFNRMSIARQVLKDERKYEDLNEVAKLFSIHKD